MSRRPRPLGEVVSGLRSDLAPATLLGDVQGAWTDVAGEAVAAHATPVSERAGVVTVRCEAAVWAAELEMMSGPLLERLADRLHGARRLTGLRFVTGP